MCTEQLRRAAEDCHAALYDARVVQDGETYCIVQFPPKASEGIPRDQGAFQPLGVLTARGIPDLASALAMARAQSLLRTLEKARSELVQKSSRREYFEYKYRDEVLCEIDHELGKTADEQGEDK
jgi:hypothetical protein